MNLPVSLRRIVLASNNPGKLREFAALFAPAGIEVVAQEHMGVSEAEEPHGTFIENALAKARHASSATGLPALADDSGLCVSALHDAPGVFSARYAALQGTTQTSRQQQDAANNALLIETLRAHADKRARYVCVLALMRHANDPQPLIAEASWSGAIVAEPHGDGGFGYDAHFFLPDLGCTAAQLSLEEKNRISHRGVAIQRLLTLLKNQS